jgi:hypothetical protein
MFPSPSVGPPLLSASWSPPLFCGIALFGGGAGAGVVVGGGALVVVGAGGAVVVVGGAAAVGVVKVAVEVAVATGATGAGARTVKGTTALACAPFSNRISR